MIVSSYHLFRRESSAIEWRKGIISFTVNRNQSPILVCPCNEKERKFFSIFHRSSHHSNYVVVQLKTLCYLQELTFPAVFLSIRWPKVKIACLVLREKCTVFSEEIQLIFVSRRTYYVQMSQVSFLVIKWFLLHTGYIYFFVKFKYYA